MALLDQPTTSTGRLAGRGWTVAFVINLVVQVGIILTGGLVRLTGSGLGCPTWPQCTPGSYIPTYHQAEGIHKWIEFGNRLLSFVVVIAAVIALVAAFRHPRTSRGLRWLGALPLIGSLLQAVVGGVIVLLDLHPVWVGAHFIISAGLVAVSALLLLRCRWAELPTLHHPQAKTKKPLRVLTAVLTATGFLVVVLGVLVTGAGPHSGDAETPYRIAIDPRLLSWLHADVVLVFVGVLLAVGLVAWLGSADRTVKWWVGATTVVTVAQGAVGYTQYFTGLPIILVAIHMVGAALLTIAVTGLAHSVARSTTH